MIRKLARFEPKVIHKESNIMSVLALVGSGLGVSIVPKILEQTLHQPGLIFKDLTISEDYIDISLAFVNRHPKSSTLAFIEHVKQQK